MADKIKASKMARVRLISKIIFACLLFYPLSLTVAEEIESIDAKPILSDIANCSDFLKRNRLRDVRDCSISEQGVFGTVGNNTYYYVLYCIIPDRSPGTAVCGDGSFSARYHRENGRAIYVRKATSTKVELFMEHADPEIGTCIYNEPKIIKNSFGTFMHVPIRESTNANINYSEYYLWSKTENKWILLDFMSWRKDLHSRLPSGLAMRKGIWPDIQAMTAETGLYREGDANCCPSGGRAFVKLTVQDGRVSISSVEFRKDNDQ